jgi:hypothetical protein
LSERTKTARRLESYAVFLPRCSRKGIENLALTRLESPATNS